MAARRGAAPVCAQRAAPFRPAWRRHCGKRKERKIRVPLSPLQRSTTDGEQMRRSRGGLALVQLGRRCEVPRSNSDTRGIVAFVGQGARRSCAVRNTWHECAWCSSSLSLFRCSSILAELASQEAGKGVRSQATHRTNPRRPKTRPRSEKACRKQSRTFGVSYGPSRALVPAQAPTRCLRLKSPRTQSPLPMATAHWLAALRGR